MDGQMSGAHSPLQHKREHQGRLLDPQPRICQFYIFPSRRAALYGRLLPQDILPRSHHADSALLRVPGSLQQKITLLSAQLFLPR
jgi:hypothetical protein